MNTYRVYAALLRLYPYDYRIRFSGEMRSAFAESILDYSEGGRFAFCRFVIVEVANLIGGAVREWLSKFTSDPSRRGRTLPDPRVMRPVDIAKEIWFAEIYLTIPGCVIGDLREAQGKRDFFLQQMVDAIARRDYEAARAYSHKERAEGRKLLVSRDRKAPG